MGGDDFLPSRCCHLISSVLNRPRFPLEECSPPPPPPPPTANPTPTLTPAPSTPSIHCTLLDDVRQAGGHTESVDKLLEAGASLDNTDKRSLNALGHAIQKYDRILCLSHSSVELGGDHTNPERHVETRLPVHPACPPRDPPNARIVAASPRSSMRCCGGPGARSQSTPTFPAGPFTLLAATVSAPWPSL